MKIVSQPESHESEQEQEEHKDIVILNPEHINTP